MYYAERMEENPDNQVRFEKEYKKIRIFYSSKVSHLGYGMPSLRWLQLDMGMLY